MIITDPDEKALVESSHRDEEILSPDQSPPPYSSLPPQGSSPELAQSQNPPPDLAPTNYLHVNEGNNTAKRKIILDLSIPRLPAVSQAKDIPHLLLDSQNGSVSWEVWVLRTNPKGSARERACLHFHTHNGNAKALVHLHRSTIEPRPFLSIKARAHNGSVTIAIPRSFRGQLMLRTHNGQVLLSSALAPRAATLATSRRTYSYFVGNQPSSGKWNTGTGESGDEVDEVIGSCHNGSVRVSYEDEDNDEDVSSTKGPGIFSSLFKAMGF